MRGAFPNYASSLICTRSGTLVYAGRFPGLGLHTSRDGGMTWRSYRIDQAIWANGTVYEVEPDVHLIRLHDQRKAARTIHSRHGRPRRRFPVAVPRSRIGLVWVLATYSVAEVKIEAQQ